jgi:hypothetical protein
MPYKNNEYDNGSQKQIKKNEDKKFKPNIEGMTNHLAKSTLRSKNS